MAGLNIGEPGGGTESPTKLMDNADIQDSLKPELLYEEVESNSEDQKNEEEEESDPNKEKILGILSLF